jgi:perosamine synthetase
MSTMMERSIPVARPSFRKEEEAAVLEVLRSGWVSQGPRVAEFEKRFAEYVGAAHAVAVSSCTTGLHLALLAAGVKSGDEVICPSLSFIATANSIAYAGAVPVFADIDPATYNMDPRSIENLITTKTRAILAVHQVGLPCDLATITDVADAHGLAVVEDAACAIGSEYNGLRIGAPHAAMACFSFHPRKILTTGEGGMITTADEQLAARLRRLRQHAMTVSDLVRHNSSQVVTESYDEIGYNYRMTDLQAAVGLVQLRRLDDMLAERRRLAARYSEALATLGWITPPCEPVNCRHNYQSYMVMLRDEAPVSRDALMQYLLDRGVSTRRSVMATHREAPYWNPDTNERLPNTNWAADHGLVLPLFYSMSEGEQDYVIQQLKSIS